jgi:hypothetical protein
MRHVARHLPVVALVAVLTACSATGGGTDKQSADAPGASSSDQVLTTGALGMLPVPEFATPWKTNSSDTLTVGAFVNAFFIPSARYQETQLYTRRRFQSGMIEGWTDNDGSGQSIAIAQFSGATGALSAFDDLSSYYRAQPKPATVFTDSAVGGLGMASPTLDSQGYTITQVTAHIGSYLVTVHEFAAASPNEAAAKALILKQYKTLRAMN